eukprot:scaffold48558_cov54-Phaeocystis_antarctica.AAC.1
MTCLQPILRGRTTHSRPLHATHHSVHPSRIHPWTSSSTVSLDAGASTAHTPYHTPYISHTLWIRSHTQAPSEQERRRGCSGHTPTTSSHASAKSLPQGRLGRCRLAAASLPPRCRLAAASLPPRCRLAAPTQLSWARDPTRLSCSLYPLS